jgi:hypothetical protein
MLTDLENAVLTMLLRKPDEPFNTLRQQLRHATVSGREFTGVGFFTEFALRRDSPVCRDLPDMALGDVGANVPNLEHGIGFVLFVRGGALSTLEGYTYDEPWPDNTDGFALFEIAPP